MASRKHIPRGCRTNYIPDLTDSILETGNKLTSKMAEEKKKRWEEVITSTDLTHNSRKAWEIIRKISKEPTIP